MLLFSSIFLSPEIICKMLKYYENIYEGRCFFDNLKKYPVEVFFPFSAAILQKHTWMGTFLWSYIL